MLKRIEVNLKNGKNYILYNVSKYSDLTFLDDILSSKESGVVMLPYGAEVSYISNDTVGPIWFWVEWEDGTRRYIASSEIQDIWIQDEDEEDERNILHALCRKIRRSSK